MIARQFVERRGKAWEGTSLWRKRMAEESTERFVQWRAWCERDEIKGGCRGGRHGESAEMQEQLHGYI